ncbi:heavy metal-binding domain-containing protein [bacterium]|nr:heavy metal-binding domain-containing protein [bacterium]
MVQLGIFLFLIFLGLVVGRARERGHFRNLEDREQRLQHMLVTDIKSFPGGADPGKGGALVMGQAVIASDYLKSFLAGLRKLIGGELRSYETLMERARREAILRMLEQADDQGFNAVCNLRMGTADIGGMSGSKGAAMVEAFATGTAYRIPEQGHAQATG